ncbi:MAG: sugar phosphate nucleotidyltransferase [Candidatus Dormibacteraeota bacterium]|nr:sugar phosphate nucleotidyltransferase [Candidatus Dormibacteraeota bacterium]
MALHILVLAGGSGTRLWPLSRAPRPKHLLPLGPDGQTLLRATVDRVATLADEVHVVTAASQADACSVALRGAAKPVDVIAEPTARGTGPALGLAVHQIAGADPEALIVSVHADHDVADGEAYRAAVLAVAGWAAATQGLATVGLTPTFPATGLGYIALGASEPPDRWAAPPGSAADPVLIAAAAALPAAHVASFVEKPPLEQATRFLEDGHHLWNLGLFAWTASAFLAELVEADPDLDEGLRRVVQARSAGEEDRASTIYASLRSVAVDPLVMERSSHLTVVRAGFGWSDLGSWADLLAARRALADADGNVAEGDALFINSRYCLVEAGGGRTIAVLGLDGVVVVDTGDAVLVMAADASQDVKAVVERLRSEGRAELL